MVCTCHTVHTHENVDVLGCRTNTRSSPAAGLDKSGGGGGMELMRASRGQRGVARSWSSPIRLRNVGWRFVFASSIGPC